MSAMTPEQRLQQLGLVLPTVSAPRGNFDAYVLDGHTLYLSGKGSPLRNDMAVVPKVGREISTEEARQHARDVSLQLIATGTDYPEIARWIQPVLAAANQNPGLARPRLDYEPTSPRVVVNIDREKAASLGISAQTIGRALEKNILKTLARKLKNDREWYEKFWNEYGKSLKIGIYNSIYSGSDTVDKLKDLIEMYEVASVGDLYSLLGITANHVDENWGWHDLSASAIVRSRDGFFLDLPKPENIRSRDGF